MMTVETNNNSMGDELEFDSKKLQVGERIYYIDMKENKNGRFIKLVEGLGYGRMSRIVVPLSIAGNFIEKLKENNEFHITHPKSDTAPEQLPAVATTTPTTETGDQQEEFPTIIHSSTLFILNRRFYFDLREHKDGYRRLRISYVMKTKRINLGFVTDALPNLIEIMEDYIQLYADGAPTTTTPTTSTSTGIRQPTTAIASTLKVETTNNHTKASPKVRSKRSSTAAAAATTTAKEVNNTKPLHIKKSALVVSEKPPASKQTVANKVYSIEVVTGEQNAFVRMTELIGNSKKATFHVPLEACTLWRDAIVKFVNEITPEEISNAAALRLAAEAANLTLQADKATI